MAERDFHFEYENSIPVKKKPENRKKPKPSPPVNSRRNPSVAVNYESPYDEFFEEKTVTSNSEEKYVKNETEPKERERAFSEEDIKIYSRKTPEKKPPEKSGKLMYLAIVLIVIGICFLGVGIYFWITNFL